VYVRDPGLLHRLLGLDDQQALLGHPKLGASWEGFVIEQLLARTGIGDAWFWGTHGGAEIDLVLQHGGGLTGIEIKRTDAPRLTPSIRNAIDDLGLDRVIVAHAGDRRFAMAPEVEAVGAVELLTDGIS